MSESDDYDEIFDKLRKFFKFDSGVFDMDFFVMPPFGANEEKNPEKENKPYKISYHFDSNKDKPEIKIEKNIDQEKLKEYFKKFNIQNKNIPNLQTNAEESSPKTIDANEISLEPCPPEEESCKIEPYAEINEYDGFSEIIFEAPGVELEDVILTLESDEKSLTVNATKGKRTYNKELYIPFKTSLDNCKLEVNNGIVHLTVQRKNKKEY